MLTRMNQRGEGKLGCVFGLLILAAAVFVAYKIIPVKVKATEFSDAVHDNARSAGTMSVDSIRKSILMKAQQLQLPVSEQNLEIKRTSDSISIKVSYTVPIEFPGYVLQWKEEEIANYPVF